MHFNNLILNVFNCYFPPHGDIIEQLNEFSQFNFHNSFNLVVGDLNCKARSWGYDSDNDRGRKMTEFIASSNLHIANIPDYGPTFVSPINVGFPDLTLISSTIYNYLKNWGILDMETHSDHKWLDQNNIIHDKQYGFLEGKSCDLAISDIVETIKSRVPNEHLALVSLDIRSAFDNMNWPVLFNIFNDINLPTFYRNFIYYYLCERKVFYVNEVFETSRTCFRGCPQGSVIAPIIWNIYINKVLNINDGELLVQAFADDLALMVGGNTARILEMNTNIALDKVSTLLDTLRLNLSVQKCQAIVFRSHISQKLSRRNSTVLNRRPTFKINNHSIKVTDSLKILGITIDNKLT
ncbi:hypothetical protein AVEN_79733-1 [Araneus ventricosus]|uniref:Reverse transcriptase domain-containing protein n=1 Tax=Araneus ventricosus TaxID=182803 RepID=A0A4Y2Q6X7_ARAVE|nr:hypothetical protein AVEN_79733-1 [Araneus ventricosus]